MLERNNMVIKAGEKYGVLTLFQTILRSTLRRLMKSRPPYKKAEQIWIKVNKGISWTSHDNGSVDGHQLFGKHSKHDYTCCIASGV